MNTDKTTTTAGAQPENARYIEATLPITQAVWAAFIAVVATVTEGAR